MYKSETLSLCNIGEGGGRYLYEVPILQRKVIPSPIMLKLKVQVRYDILFASHIAGHRRL